MDESFHRLNFARHKSLAREEVLWTTCRKNTRTTAHGYVCPRSLVRHPTSIGGSDMGFPEYQAGRGPQLTHPSDITAAPKLAHIAVCPRIQSASSIFSHSSADASANKFLPAKWTVEPIIPFLILHSIAETPSRNQFTAFCENLLITFEGDRAFVFIIFYSRHSHA
jgi:hypothetical protein